MRDLSDKILVFVHVKKTAGISVQWMLAKQYGKRFFGGHIHSALKKVAAANPLEKDGLSRVPLGSCICKHWKYEDFKSIEDKCVFVTVAREPVSRIVCHYNFYRKHYPKGVPFAEYIKQPNNINLYSRSLPPLSKLTEAYLFEDLEESIGRSDIIKPASLPKTNKTPYKYKVKDSDLEEFKSLNQEDMLLYEELRRICV